MNYYKIADHIIFETQQQSISGFQYISTFDALEDFFEVKLTQKDIDRIEFELQCREEVADLEVEDDCFDVVLFLNHAPNYNENALLT